jgi:hypothetical protein
MREPSTRGLTAAFAPSPTLPRFARLKTLPSPYPLPGGEGPYLLLEGATAKNTSRQFRLWRDSMTQTDLTR